MQRWHAKLICGCIMFVSMFIVCLLPIWVFSAFERRGKKGVYILNCCICFGGGVFLAVYLLFMAPEVRELVEEYLLHPKDIYYPVPEAVMAGGFFLVMFVEKLIHVCQDYMSSKKEKTREKKNRMERSVSLSPLAHSMSQASLATLSLGMAEEDKGGRRSSYVFSLSSEEKPANNHHPPTYDSLDSHGENGIKSAEPDDRSASVVTLPAITLPEPEEAAVDDGSANRTLMMVIAQALSCILEGMTIGLKQTIGGVWAIFGGVIAHELVIAFALGIQLMRIFRRAKPMVLTATAYAFLNPIGVAIGTAVYETGGENDTINLANGMLQAICSGCFIYVTFFEILDGQVVGERDGEKGGTWAKLLCVFFGFASMGAIRAIPEGDEDPLPEVNCTVPCNETQWFWDEAVGDYFWINGRY